MQYHPKENVSKPIHLLLKKNPNTTIVGVPIHHRPGYGDLVPPPPFTLESWDHHTQGYDLWV